MPRGGGIRCFPAKQRARARLADYCRETWDALNTEGRLPRARDRQGHEVALPYVSRHDGLGRPVPNVCLKVPTGGGKTLLACAALERIQIEYFKQQTGLVLWIVPSEAIYAQTWKRFANREDPYRQMLERASGGRVKLLEKVFETGLPAGELQLAVGPRELRFELLLENNWRERIRRPRASLDG